MPSNSPFSPSHGENVGDVIEWKNGEKYQGEIFKNSFHGKGTYTWADRVTYSGFFYVNKRNGYGRQEFPDRRVFTGLYKDDHQYGAGIMEYPTHTEDVGFWKGDFLIRLCTTHPSIPAFQEVAIGYTSGMDKIKKTVDLLAELRRPNPLDEYLDSTELGGKLTSNARESLYATCIPNPDSMFFNRKLYNYVFQKSLANEKKSLTTKTLVKPERDIVPKGVKTPKLTNLTDLFQPKPKKKQAVKISENTEASDEDQQKQESTSTAEETTSQEMSTKIPDYSELKPDCPSTMVSWNNNPLLIEIQKHTVRFQNFLVSCGFPIEKLMNCNRDVMKPPGDIELASNDLLKFAYEGDSNSALRLFLNQSVHPDVCDAKGNTALIVASMQCHDEMINCLLDMGACVNNCNDDGLAPISTCIVQLHPASSLIFNCHYVRLYAEEIGIECVLSPVEKTDKKLRAVQEGDSHSPTRIPTVTRRARGDKDGGSSRYPTDENAISSKAKNKAGGKTAVTATTITATRAHSSLDKQTSNGSDDSKICNRRAVPSEADLVSTLNLLLLRGASVDNVVVPANPVIIAIRANNVGLLRLLLQHGANPNLYHQEKDSGRLAPLHLACSLPAEAAAVTTTLLLEHGANPDLQAEEDRPQPTETTDENISTSTMPEKSFSSDGLTALVIAAARPDFDVSLELVKRLLKYGCNPSPPLFLSHSPLSMAIANGNEAVIKALLNGGADPNRAVPEDVGPIVGAVLSTQLNYRWTIGKRIQISRELIVHKANVVGPFKLGFNRRLGSLIDYIMVTYSRDSKEGRTQLRDDEKQLVIENLSSYIQDSVRNILNFNRTNVALRRKIIEEMTQKGTPENIPSALGKLQPNLLPMEMCYECCKSCGLLLHPCTRCYSVLYCNRFCQMKSWDECHKEECFINEEIPLAFLKKLSHRTTFECHGQVTSSSKTAIIKKTSQILSQKKALK